MIIINLDKAKVIAHDIRRKLREEEFKPLDKAIALQIPGNDVVQLEAERQAIRDKYAAIQDQLDAATTPEELKSILNI